MLHCIFPSCGIIKTNVSSNENSYKFIVNLVRSVSNCKHMRKGEKSRESLSITTQISEEIIIPKVYSYSRQQLLHNVNCCFLKFLKTILLSEKV